MLAIRGSVRGPGGPVAGARVVAVVHGVVPLHEQFCPACRFERSRFAEWYLQREAEPAPVAEGRSQTDGSFALEGIEPGYYRLWAEGGTLIGAAEAIPAGREGVLIVLEEGLVLTGTTVDSEHQPVGGATLTAACLEQHRFFHAQSDAQGRFRIGPVPSGHHVVAASAPGRVANFVASGGRPELPPIVLEAASSLSGVVRLKGEPVSGAVVTLRFDPFDPTPAITRTDAAGSFTFPSVAPTEQHVSAVYGSLQASRILLVTAGKPLQSLTLDLEPGGDLE